MKRYLIIPIILTALLGFVGSAQAESKSTISFSPETKTVKVGDNFNIKILVDPQGEFLDTVRAIVNYPSDKLEAIYFALNNLYPNPAPANFIDNEQGLFSQGGAIFAGQTSEKGIFGTITFKALLDGEALISLTENSRLISSGQEKINLTNLGQAIINIERKEEIPPEEIIGQVIVQSSSHPVQEKWYNNSDVELNWQMAEGSGEIISYIYAFDQNPETDPSVSPFVKGGPRGILLNKETTNKIFEKVNDGISYFHIKAKFTDQSFSDVVHFRINIDTESPHKIMPATDKYEFAENKSTELRFATLDDTSGIDYYEMAIDGVGFQKQTSPYTLKDLKPGKHTIIVRAIDKAGNISAGFVNVNVVPREESAIVSFLKKWGILIVVLFIIIAYWAFISIKKRRR